MTRSRTQERVPESVAGGTFIGAFVSGRATILTLLCFVVQLMGSAGLGAGLTTEHLKSHLQKYRLNYERSRQEFLDFYDQSAKKNLKRRRKQASRAGEHNTMFVFPIVPNNKKNDSDDESGDEADESMSMSDSTQSEQPTPRDNNDLNRSASFSGLLQGGERTTARRGRSTSQQTQPVDQLGNTSPNDNRAYFTANPTQGAAAQTLQAFGAVPVSSGIPKQNLAGSQIDSRAMLRYPGASAAMVMPTSGPMNVLTDPQWNILNSMMMSPQMVGMAGNMPPQQLQFATNEAQSSAGVPPDDYGLAPEDPPDLQLQMHMAMQAHMNLHRQMLTRKVEVSQHATAAQIAAANNAAYGGQQQQQWMNRQVQQQQQQQQQVQQQQQQRQQVVYQQSPPMQYAPEPPQGRRSFSVQQTIPENQPAPLNILPRPSISSVPVQPVTASDSRTTAPSVIDEVMAEVEAAPPSASLDTRTEDDALDLYRWDRIDLNVDLDDDDLFGFLKS